MNTIPKNFWSSLVTVFILLVVFLAAASIKELKSISYVGKDTAQVNTITVNGKGESVSKPDIATFSFTVTENAKTVVEAQNAATAKIDAALKSIRVGGVADKDIKTTSYNINPHYDYQDGVCVQGGICRTGKSVLTGYDVSETISIKIRNLDKAGVLFASIGSAGVQNVDSLSFSIDDVETVKAAARAIAIDDAKTKAQELAKELGVSIVRIVNFSDQSNSPFPMYADSMSMKAVAAPMAAAPQIPAGEQKVTSNVSITYEIK
jgi:uncharacterized protein